MVVTGVAFFLKATHKEHKEHKVLNWHIKCEQWIANLILFELILNLIQNFRTIPDGNDGNDGNELPNANNDQQDRKQKSHSLQSP